MEVKALLDRVAEKFAARGAGLGAGLELASAEDFERRCGVQLPPDYRWFVTHVGGSADGPPAYGLLRLGEYPGDLRPDERRAWDYPSQLSRPFPFTQGWFWEGGDASTEGGDDDVTLGSVILGTDGCAMYWHLIVTGPERGNVWLFTEMGVQPTEPKRSFLSWIEDWLDGQTDWFG